MDLLKPFFILLQIPFSKFILGSKGRIQDKQTRMRLDRVTHFGITCADKINGPFNLEIEYVGRYLNLLLGWYYSGPWKAIGATASGSPQRATYKFIYIIINYLLLSSIFICLLNAKKWANLYIYWKSTEKNVHSCKIIIEASRSLNLDLVLIIIPLSSEQ